MRRDRRGETEGGESGETVGTEERWGERRGEERAWGGGERGRESEGEFRGLFVGMCACATGQVFPTHSSYSSISSNTHPRHTYSETMPS